MRELHTYHAIPINHARLLLAHVKLKALTYAQVVLGRERRFQALICACQHCRCIYRYIIWTGLEVRFV